MDRNHLMCTDELHKFSDSTLNHVRTALNDIATGIQMEYLPKRKWSKQDKQRARVMINAIDKKLRDRRTMDPNSSIGKICLGKDNRVSVNDGMESHRDWETPKLQGTACSQEKKEAKAFTFYRIEIDEVSERYIAPCFMNGLEAYDGVINLEQDKNLISNEFAVKLCLEHEVKDRDTVVKKELILALRGEIYFVNSS
ncbi:hypothetical protein Tco_1015532 [Tanacetum coccineum]|uniref:Uncharacterized protein n=1 Tax=Tanacetum coccineum TaxID=301880 RepID=A0ABQ5FL66_9ASTR